MPGFDNLHATATRLRSVLRDQLGVPDQDLDRGVPRRVWALDFDGNGTADAPPVLYPGKPDGIIADAEVFQESFRRLEEIRFGASSFDSDIAPSRAAQSISSNFFMLYARNAAYFPPWLIDDGDPRSVADSHLRAILERIVEETNGNVDLLLQSLHRPRAQGGLGLLYRYDPNNSHRHQDAVEAFVSGSGDCNAFSFLFYALAARAGLRPQFILIGGERRSSGDPFHPIYHVGVAVRLDPQTDSLTPCDPSHGMRLSESLYEWYLLTPSEMLAYHLRNVALTNERDPAVQERLLLQASRLAPYSFDISHDVAWFYEHVQHSPTNAALFLRRALSINPTLIPVWETTPRVR